ncbi:MAG: thioredoxin [Acidobacteriota bacterium]|nr:thioredoxin [Acidobacteriota bacterium]
MSSEHIIDGSDAGFEQLVLKSGLPVLVDFWAPWCAPCGMIAPVLEEVARTYQGRLQVVKVNVDDNPQSSQTYGVMTIPTLMLFKGGEVRDKAVGVVSKEKIETLIASHVKAG